MHAQRDSVQTKESTWTPWALTTACRPRSGPSFCHWLVTPWQHTVSPSLHLWPIYSPVWLLSMAFTALCHSGLVTVIGGCSDRAPTDANESIIGPRLALTAITIVVFVTGLCRYKGASSWPSQLTCENHWLWPPLLPVLIPSYWTWGYHLRPNSPWNHCGLSTVIDKYNIIVNIVDPSGLSWRAITHSLKWYAP